MPPRTKPAIDLDIIRELLWLRKWHHWDLAKALGLSTNTINRWFMQDPVQRRFPTEVHAVKIKEMLYDVQRELIDKWQHRRCA